MIRITVYAGVSETDERPPSVKRHEPLPEQYVAERLGTIGLEWKTADYFQTRQVVIVLEPVADADASDKAEETLREIRALLDD